MRKIKLFLLMMLAGMYANSQVTGVKTIPGDYATLAAAIADLNTVGVGAGGATINLTIPETAPTGGYLLGSAILNASTTVANPLVINGGGNLITAYASGTSAGGTVVVPDAVFRVAGVDYLTLNQLNIGENALNTTPTTQMELGIMLRSFTTSDACQNVTIQNCTVNLNGPNTGMTTASGPYETGISAQNVPYTQAISPVSTTVVAPVGATGIQNNIVIRGCTIQNCYNGIAVIGNSTLANYSPNITIGGDGAGQGNTISGTGTANAGITTTGYGIYQIYANSLTVVNNSWTSTPNVVNAHYGIYLNTSIGNIRASKNTLTGSTAASSTSLFYPLYLNIGSGAGLVSSRCDSNTTQNVTLGGTNTFYGNYHFATTSGLMTSNFNVVNNITRSALGGTTYGMFTSASGVGTRQALNNSITNITHNTTATNTSTFYLFYPTGSQTGVFRGNVINNVQVTGAGTGSSTIYSCYNLLSTNTHTIDSNRWTNINVNNAALSSSVYGMYASNTSGTINITRNNFAGLSIPNTATSGALSGMYLTGAATRNVVNNFVSNLTATAINADNAIKGIECLTSGTNNIYNNTIFLGSAAPLTSSGINFGVSGIVWTGSPILDLRNNIVYVDATPSGTGMVAAIRTVDAGTIGVVPAPYAASSNNNLYYAPNATNSYLYCQSGFGSGTVTNAYNLTNDPGFNSSCGSLFKTFALGRDAATFTEQNLSGIGAPTDNKFAPSGTSYAKSGGQTLALAAVDYDNITRATPPDMGALQFAGTASDASAPVISYTAISSTSYCNTLPLISATITDVSGVNVTAGTKPRLYYKKSTDANAYVGNTSVDNGWKFVEATNAASPFQLQMNAALLQSAPALGDIIQYFVIAQDLAGVPNVGLNNAGLPLCPTSVALTASHFPTNALPAINAMTISAPSFPTLGATANPTAACLGGTSTLTVADTGAGPLTLPVPLANYGVAAFTQPSEDELFNVTINGTPLNNTSNCATIAPGAGSAAQLYGNYTTGFPQTNLLAGASYTGSITNGDCGSGSGTNSSAIFIDWNRDGVFQLPAERVWGTASANTLFSVAGTVNPISFTIPGNATPGATLMRVIVNESAFTASSTGGSWGETEDYVVQIFGAPSALPNSAFAWSGGSITGSPNRTVTATNITANTTYTCTVTDAGGCTTTTSVTVNVATPVIATGTTGTTTYCSATPSTNITLTTLNGSTPINTIWTGGPITTPTSPLTICGTATGFAAAYAPANWVLTLTNSNGTLNTAGAPGSIALTSSNGLSGAGTTNYAINIPPTCSGNVTFNWNYTTVDGAQWDYPRYQVNAGPVTNFPGYNLAGGTSQSGTATIPVAPGDVLNLQAYSADNFGGACTITISNFTAPSSTTYNVVSGLTANLNPPVGTTTYTVTALDACGTTSSTTVSITVDPTPTVAVTPGSGNLCDGLASTQTASGSGTAPVYTWMPGSLTGAIQNITQAATTTYTVTSTDGPCSATATFTLTSVSSPTFSTTTASPAVLCPGDLTALNTSATVISGGTGPGNYNIATIPHAPVVPPGATTPGPAGDDTYSGAIALPFPFTFYGVVKNNVYISTNGFISFDPASGSGCCSGQVLPSTLTPNDVIALNWEDMNTTVSGNIDYFTFGTAPNRKFVVRWNNVGFHASGGAAITAQIVLNESDQSIEIHNTSGGPFAGNITTIGIENSTGTLATAVPGRNGSSTGWTYNNEAWKFSQLVITPVSNYAWDGGLTGNVVTPAAQSTNANPSAATVYTVTATAGNGCTSTSTVAVTMKPTITGTATATPASICLGQSTTLDGNVPLICGGTETTFAGTYAPANWTFSQDNSNGTVNTAGAPANIILTSGTNSSSLEGSTIYSKVIECAGTVSFNWAYSTPDIAFLDRPRVRINSGAWNEMNGFNFAGASTQNGTQSLTVAAGDTVRLAAWTFDNDGLACTVTISNFSAPALPVAGFVNFWDAPTAGTLIGGAPSTVTPAIAGTTTYYAQYNTVNAAGCTNPVRLAIPVTVNAIPIVTASSSPSPATICSSTSLTLTGGGATTYTWTDGVNTPTDGTAFIPTASSTYTVTGTTAGCSSTATVAVTVISGTAPTAIGDTICGPGIVNLTASGAPSDTLFWYTAASGGSPVGQGTSFNPSISSDVTYYVEGNGVLGSSTQSYLTGLLDNTGGGGQQSSTNYNIFDVLAPSITLDSVTIYPGSTGPQTVNIQLANSSAVVLQTIPVAINPTVIGDPLRIPVGMVIPAGTGYQLGQSASSISLFRNSSGVTYPYTVPGVVSITNSAAGATFYYFFYNWRVTTGLTTYCPSATRTPVLAKVNPLPAVTASATPSSVCLGSSTTFTGGGANTYTWSDGTNTPTNAVAFTPPLAGTSTYTVIGTDANLCSATSTVTLSVNILPASPVATATPSAICEGGTSSLSTVVGPSTGPSTDPGASCNPTYSSGNSFGDFINNVNFGTINNTTGANAVPANTFYSSPVVTVMKGMSYPLTVQVGTFSSNDVAVWVDFNRDGDYNDLGEKIGEIDNSGVSAIVPFTVAIPVTAQLGYTRMRIVEADQGTIGGMLPCAAYSFGESEDYQIDIQDVPPTIGWSGPATIASATSATTNVTPATTGTLTYTVSVTDANGCTSTSSTTLTVNTLPTVTATPTTQTVCENASATVTGGGASSYVWTGGISDATPFTVTATNTYTVTGTDGNGCSNTATAVVNMNAAPLVTAGATPTTTCNNTVVTPTGGGASTYTWSGGLTDNTPFIATATATYTVTGTDGIGCSATSSVTVTVTPASGTLAPATSNQSQTHNDDFNVNYNDASCNLIATVDDGAGGNILGLTTATVNVEATAGVHNGQPFVRRWYQITPTSNGSADVILYINQADFNDYNAAVTAPYLPLPTSGNNSDPNIANIRITKNSDAGLGNSPVVITPTVNWNGTYWELSFNTPSFSQFRVHSVNPGNVPLPATVTNFSGRKMSTSDMLEWTTASEQNNAYFNLQHGTDGINFTTIAKVNSQAANGNSSSILNYSFENTKPQLGHNYYRLQQVDIDNHSTMNAKVVDIIWGTNGSTVSIYPNPTQDVLNIDLYTTKVQNTTVKVLDMSGRIVKQIQGRSEAGMNKLSISLGEIASGVYTVQVFENDNLTHVSKVKKND